MLRLREYDSSARFVEALRPLWEPREPELNLLVGVASGMTDAGGKTRGGVLEDAHGAPRAGALLAEDGLILGARGTDDAAELAARLAVTDPFRRAKRLRATLAEGRAFMDEWTRHTGDAATRIERQHIWALRDAPTAPPSAGRLRPAESHDTELLASWFCAFDREALADASSSVDAKRTRVARGLAAGQLFVWEVDGEPMSTASVARPTPNGIAINRVYTPPGNRGRGYASACVAALSASALASGKQFTCLYTDSTKPALGALYERLGYRVVTQAAIWRWAPNL